MQGSTSFIVSAIYRGSGLEKNVNTSWVNLLGLVVWIRAKIFPILYFSRIYQ